MYYSLPITIESGQGEKIIFREIIQEPDGDKIIIEGHCKPNAGPAMHVHYKQDEGLTVVQGKMGCQIMGQEPVYYEVGQEAVFLRNTPHRFWNAGTDELVVSSWVKPANSIIFFLSTLYAAQQKSGSKRPALFDAAYLMVRYNKEYGLPTLPPFVKNVMMPLTFFIGKMLGKYRAYNDAPEPLK